MNTRQRIFVHEVMRKDVTVVDGKLDIMEALRIMHRVKATCLMVEKRHEHDEYGMLLFSDVAKQVLAKDRAPERVNVFEIMAKPVISVRPDMDIRYCARLFENCGISHAPVLQNEEILGIVSYYLLVLGGLPDLS